MAVQVMRIDTSHLLNKAELGKEDANSHKVKHFYDAQKVNSLPEFRF